MMKLTTTRLFCARRGCAALLSTALTAAGLASAPDRPNILLLIADDLGYGELGCQGNREVPTPRIDSLAKLGIRFTSGYVTAPFCAPSRAGLLTGRNQARFGYDINPTGEHNLDPRLGLPLDEPTLAELLKRAGYATALVGKWHLGGTANFHPRRRGFDEFFGFLHEGHFYAALTDSHVVSFLRTNHLPSGLGPHLTAHNLTWSTHMLGNEPPYDANNPVLRGFRPVEECDYLTDALAREARNFILRHRGAPFFLQVAFNAPHSPMQALQSDLEKFSHIQDLHRRVFAAMLARLDESIGRVLDALRETSLEEQTLIFFISDNGGPTRELTSSNAPLRGGKGQLHEGGIRIPFIVQWKGRLPAGEVYEAPVTALDIVPTALAAAGAKPSVDKPLDGVNLLPYITGEKPGPPHAALYWRYGANCAIRQGNWKVVKQIPDQLYRLYDLARDLGERTDLRASNPELTSEMQTHLENWLATLPQPLALSPRPGSSAAKAVGKEP